MNKKIGVLLLATLVLTCACSKKNGTMTCTSKTTNGSYTTELTAVINYTDGYVDKLTTEEVVTTDTDQKAKDFKTLLDDYYISYNKIDGFNNEVEQKNKKVISKTTINYKTIDTDKLISIDESNKNIIKDKKVSITDIKNNYINQGASCK